MKRRKVKPNGTPAIQSNSSKRKTTLTKHATTGDVIMLPNKNGLYIVENAEYTGGSGSFFGTDYYPDAWHVYARRLADNGEYNPKAKLITFTQDTHCYNNCIDNVKRIEKRKKIVSWVKR